MREEAFIIDGAILDLLDMIIVKVDREGTITYVNRFGLNLVQKEKGAILGKKFFETCTLPREKQYVKAHFDALQSGRKLPVDTLTCTFVTPQNEEKSILWKSLPYLGKEGTPEGYLFWAQKITDASFFEQSDIRFKELVESLNDWIWEIDCDGRITYSSPRSRAVLGYDPHEMIGTTPFSYMAQGEAEAMARILRRLVDSRSGIERQQNHNIHKEGREVILETSANPILDEKGNLTGFRGVSRDITKSQKIHELLIETTDKYLTLFSQLPIPAWLVDARTARFLDVNEAAIKLYGYTKEEYLTLQISQIDVNDSQEEVEARAREIMEKGSVSFITRHRINSGNILDVKVSVQPLMINDQPVLSVTCQDLTELKTKEQKLKETTDKYLTLFSQLPIPAWLVDARTARFLDVNEASLKLYGYTKEEYLSLLISQIDLYDSQEVVERRSREIMEKGSVSFITKHRTKSGTVLDVRVSVQPVMINDRPVLSVTCQDLTELKKKEAELTRLNLELEERVAIRTKELHDAYKQLDKAQAIAHVGNWNWNITAGSLVWTDEIYRIFGLAPQQFKATYEAFLEHIHPEDVTIVAHGVQAALEQNIPYDVEHRVMRPDGEIRYVREHGIVERDAGGNPLVMIGTIHDITEYKEVIEELSVTKERLETAQSISHIGNWQRRLADDRVFWSDEVFRIFECDKTGDSSIDIRHFLAQIHPDDRKRIQEEIEANLESGKHRYTINYRIKTESGIIKHLHEEVIVFRKEGEPLFLEGTVQDITRQVRAEQAIVEYNRILNEHVIVSQTDLRGIITHASKAFCRISGYTEEELVGKKHSLIRHADMPDRVYKDIWETILSGKPWEGELKNRKKDGTFYWVRSSISPRYDDEGRMIGFTAIREDITDQKRIEELSITDELTALYNRRHFNTLFASELQRAKRDGKIFCFFIMDVDHFKRYNDTYGHQKGDAVLKKIGSLLKGAMKRSGDYVFRLGGEEFGGLFTEKNPEDARRFTQNICTLIEAARIPHEKNSASPYVSASFGLVCVDFSKDKSKGLYTDAIYKAADDKLYEAKESGRNKVLDVTFAS